MSSNATPKPPKRQRLLENTFSHDLKTAAERGTPALKGAVMATVKQIAEKCRVKYPPLCSFNNKHKH